MRNFARGYGEDNPLYCDEEYGERTRWSSQIAPQMIGIAMGSPLYGDPIPDELRKLGRGLFSGIHVFVSGQSTEWYRPLLPGDETFSFGGPETVEVKKSEFAGRSVIRTSRSVWMNQRAEIVSINRRLAILTERKTARERGTNLSIEPAHYHRGADQGDRCDLRAGAPARRGAALLGGRRGRRVAPQDGQGPPDPDRRDLLPTPAATASAPTASPQRGSASRTARRSRSSTSRTPRASPTSPSASTGRASGRRRSGTPWPTTTP